MAREPVLQGDLSADDERQPQPKNEIPADDDRDLRPQHMTDMVGQREVYERIEIAVDASTKRAEPLGHILFDGPPGLGRLRCDLYPSGSWRRFSDRQWGRIGST